MAGEHAIGRNIIAAAASGKAANEGYQGHGVLTYAILEALNKREGDSQDPVSVFGIAAHVSHRVPAISKDQFGILQMPQHRLNGNDFSLGLRAVVLRPPLEAVRAAVLRSVSARASPTESAVVTEELAPGDTVRIKGVEGSWSLIERNGRDSYVPSDALLPLRR